MADPITDEQQQQQDLVRQRLVASLANQNAPNLGVPPTVMPSQGSSAAAPQHAAPMAVARPQATDTPAPAPRPEDQMVSRAVSRLQNAEDSKAGINRIIPITQGDGFGHKLLRGVEHVGRGVLEAGEIGANIAAPGIMANVPGTYMGRAAAIGRAQSGLGVAEEAREKASQAEEHKAQADYYDAGGRAYKTTPYKGHNPTTDQDEYFTVGQDGKPNYLGVEVPSIEKPTKSTETPIGAVGATRYNSMIDAMPNLSPQQKQALHVTSAMVTGEADKAITSAQAQAGIALRKDASGDVTTEVVKRKMPDGSFHNILIDHSTGKDIRDEGEAEVSGGNQPNVDVMGRFKLQPGETGAAVMQKIASQDPIAAAGLQKVIQYQAPLNPTFPANPRRGSNQLSQQEAEGLISLIDPTWRADQFHNIAEVRKDYTSGKTGKNISNLLQGVHHLDRFQKTIEGQTGVGIPLFNSAIQGTQEGLGFKGALKGKLDVTAVSGELANIFKQSGATDSEIAQWKQSIKPNMTNRQAGGVVEGAMELLAGRLAVQAQRWEAATGKPYDFSLVDKGTRDLLASLPGGQKVLDVMTISHGGAGGGFNWNAHPIAQ